MALNSANVRVGVTGTVSVGTDLATAPTDADTALTTGWTDLGYANEDGISETRDRSTNRIRAWQNADIVRTVVTESMMQFRVTLIETKKEVLEVFYNTTVSGTDGSFVVNPGATGGRRKYCLDVIDGTDYIRTYIPQGELVEAPSEVVSKNGDPIGYELIIDAYPDTDLGGSCQKFYSALAA